MKQILMKIINTGESQVKPSVVMMVYGEGGVGKSTFVSTAPNVLLADCENGSKYLGLRDIHIDVAQIETWTDIPELIKTIKESNKYETIAIDPIGELMDKLKRHMIALGDSKLVQKDGSPTMAGWGWLKKQMRDLVKILRDTGLHVVLVAHLDEKPDEQRIVKRPKIETKIADDIVAMVDIVAYMTVVQDEKTGETKRVLIVDPGNDKYTAKDRTGQLGKVIEPDFAKIIKACQGTETYKWSKKKKKEIGEEREEKVGKTEPAKEEVIDADMVPCSRCSNAVTPREVRYSQKIFKAILCRDCMKAAMKVAKK